MEESRFIWKHLKKRELLKQDLHNIESNLGWAVKRNIIRNMIQLEAHLWIQVKKTY